MKHYTFTNNIGTTSFNFPKSDNIDYSEKLDNIILTSMINKNKYLFDYDSPSKKTISISSSSSLNSKSDFAKAANFLANFNKPNYKNGYIIGKMYYLDDGTPIVFYEDEIQIGYDWYTYDDFANFDIINSLPEKKKRTIIDIYSYGQKILSIKL